MHRHPVTKTHHETLLTTTARALGGHRDGISRMLQV